MATELIKKTIGGDEYEFEQFGAKKSLRILMRLAKIGGKPLMLSLGAFKKEGAQKKLDEKMLAEVAQTLFNGMDENTTLDLIECLTAEKVLCNGKKIIFDDHYENRLDRLFEVLGTALEVQYGNFFDGLLDKLDSGKKPPVTTPEAQT